MISANELRIGNWIYQMGDPLTVCTLDLQILEGNRPDQKMQPEDYSPIPLTPEILEKAGFKQHLHIFKIKGVSGFTIERRASRFYLKEYKIDANPIQTVHHLQNLFYDIKGQELNIQL